MRKFLKSFFVYISFVSAFISYIFAGLFIYISLENDFVLDYKVSHIVRTLGFIIIYLGCYPLIYFINNVIGENDMSYTVQEKLKIWNNFKNNKYNLQNGVTLKRLNKLKQIIWDDNDFWFFMKRKPEDQFCIVYEYLFRNKIIKKT